MSWRARLIVQPPAGSRALYCRPTSVRAPIEDTATPIPASPVAPVPTRPTSFGVRWTKCFTPISNSVGLAEIAPTGASTITKTVNTTIIAQIMRVTP
jgi:hypothetical protein